MRLAASRTPFRTAAFPVIKYRQNTAGRKYHKNTRELNSIGGNRPFYFIFNITSVLTAKSHIASTGTIIPFFRNHFNFSVYQTCCQRAFLWFHHPLPEGPEASQVKFSPFYLSIFLIDFYKSHSKPFVFCDLSPKFILCFYAFLCNIKLFYLKNISMQNIL